MKSIKWRLVFLYVTLVSIVMILCGTFIVTRIKDVAYKNLLNELIYDLEIQYVPVIQPYLDPTIYKTEEEFINKIQEQINEKIEGPFTIGKNFYLLDISTNSLIYHPVTNDEEVKETYYKRFKTREIEAVKRGETINSLIVFKNNSILNRENYGAYAMAFDYNNDGNLDYLIYIEKSLSDIEENMRNYINIIIISVLMAIILSAVLGLLFSNSLTSPITALTKSAKKIASGNLSDNTNLIEVRSDDEIGQLTQTFNHMAQELSKTVSEIYSEKNKLETVFAYMADGILVFNLKGELIHANPAAYNMLGLSIADKSFQDIIGYLNPDISLKNLLEEDSNSLQTHIITIKDTYLNACFATYIDKSNDSVGLITVLQDITEQKKLEEMQKEFVANVSHELRTPITTIKSYAETLLNGAMEDKDVTVQFLNVINNESDRMTTLVQDLLELSRLDNKQIKFNMTELDITNLLNDCYERYKLLAQKKNQRMVYHADDNYKIIGDSHRLEQVIKNIISNAIKYSPDGAQIDISITQKNTHIEIDIKDNGMGIPEEDLPRIFDRFYRVDKARSRAMGGTGLGLAIVKEIVTHHGGQIKVDSTYGKGSTFTICLPVKSVI